MKYSVSVIIATKDRADHLLNCLTSLKKSSFTNFELIIVDQSDNKKINKPIEDILKFFPRVKYLRSNRTGKSKGLNEAIAFSSASLLAFTDDDCLVDKNWLKTIFETFQKEKKIVGLFGRTNPHQPIKHKGLTCPSTFDHRESKYISQPCKHWEEIGFGNNMAWRRSFFQELGLFKEWLGPGSIGSNAEDAEIALRALINGKMLLFEPKMRIAHNKWLNKKELQKLELSYLCGEMACYGYLSFLGDKTSKDVLRKNLSNSLFDFKKDFLLRNAIKLRGSLVAIYEFFIEKIRQITISSLLP
jgi:GT2 family glycosyltransferase